MAADIRAAARPRIEKFAERIGRSPSLSIVLAGDDPASGIYVRNKLRAGREMNISVSVKQLGNGATLSEVIRIVHELNADPSCDGILVQSPLPPGMGLDAERQVFDAVDPAKDVDGFHRLNAGALMQNRPVLPPCTAQGVIELLDRSGIRIRGTRAVVIGRSDIVGKPVAMLLLHHDATVTVCHSHTPEVAREAARADILVVAVGRPGMVTPDFVKPGATVIDVGMNSVVDRDVAARLIGQDPARWRAFEQRGFLVAGDVHPDVASVASAMSHVPGGVGPMTIAMLLINTVTAAEHRHGLGVWAPDDGPRLLFP